MAANHALASCFWFVVDRIPFCVTLVYELDVISEDIYLQTKNKLSMGQGFPKLSYDNQAYTQTDARKILPRRYVGGIVNIRAAVISAKVDFRVVQH